MFASCLLRKQGLGRVDESRSHLRYENKRCTSESKSQERICSLEGGTTDCLQFCLLFCLTDDKTNFFFLLGLVSILLLLGFFYFLLCLKGCEGTAEGLPLLFFLAVAVWVRWTVGRTGRRFQILHAHGKTPDKAHVLCKGADPRLRSRRGYIPRDPEGAGRVDATQEAAQASGLQSIWKESSF